MIYGIGINDVSPENKNIKIYNLWSAMIRRCYSEKYLEKNPSYRGTKVCDDWKYFSKFQDWVINNYKDGYQLDKDIIAGDKKIYSPETCSFIPHELNMSIIEPSNINNQYPLGVTFEKKTAKMKNERTKPYRSKIMKYGKKQNIGIYKTPYEAHLGWQKAKLEYLNELMEKYHNSLENAVISGIQRRIDILQHYINNQQITKTINKI